MKLYICFSVIRHIPSHVKHVTSSARCHHTERDSCKIIENWKLQSVFSPPLENVATPFCCRLPEALIFYSCHFHMHWIIIHLPTQRISYLASDLSCTGPCKCGYLQPVCVNPPHAGLYWAMKIMTWATLYIHVSCRLRASGIQVRFVYFNTIF